jgi:heat-inducible transcriptional repressor
MSHPDELSERELRVLEAVVQSYIDTAEPAGSQTIARQSTLGVSPATIRSTMSELEEKGYLFHPHTSAGRIPTDRGYRVIVDSLKAAPISVEAHRALTTELDGTRAATEELLRRAAQVLGVLTQELGVAVMPALDRVILERLELVPVAADRLLLVFNLRSGMVRTIFVHVRVVLSETVVQEVARVLNERLGGLTLLEIRGSLGLRLRDAGSVAASRELLNIFIAQGDGLFDLDADDERAVMLGSASVLAEQPEFASNEKMRELLLITERRDLLKRALESRRDSGMTISIGAENDDARLAGFTLVTSSYQAGELRGVIGVMGPTRMPYDKVVGLVSHTSRLVEGLLA